MVKRYDYILMSGWENLVNKRYAYILRIGSKAHTRYHDQEGERTRFLFIKTIMAMLWLRQLKNHSI